MSGILTPGTISAQFHQQDNEFAVPSAVSGMSPEGPVVIAFGGMRKRLQIAAQLVAAQITREGLDSVVSAVCTSPHNTVVECLQIADLLIDAERQTWQHLQAQRAQQPPPSPLVGV